MIAGGDSARFVDEVYGDRSLAPHPLQAPSSPPSSVYVQPLAAAAPYYPPLQDTQSTLSTLSSILRKGAVWIVVAAIVGLALAAVIITFRFKSIDANADKLNLEERNQLKQKTVLLSTVASAVVAVAVIVVTRFTLKWRM